MKDVEKAESKASKEELYEEAAELSLKVQSMKEDIANFESQISDQEDLIIDLELEKKTIVREELKLRKAQQAKLTTLEVRLSTIHPSNSSSYGSFRASIHRFWSSTWRRPRANVPTTRTRLSLSLIALRRAWGTQ